MAFDFKFPDVGEGIAEGEIVKWLVKEGDDVKEDEPIAQIETDKAVVDIPSPKSGKILKLYGKEGESVKVGAVLATIGGSAEKVKKSKAKDEPKVKEKSNSQRKGLAVVGQLEEAPEEEEEKPHARAISGEAQTQKVLAAPAVRRRAAESNIDLSSIKGSGEDGRILLKDLGKGKTSTPQQKIKVKKKYDDFGYIERVPLKGIRKSISDNMIASNAVPQVTLMEDVDVTNLLAIRKKEKVKLAKEGIKLTLLPFVVKAAIAALKEVPLMNSTLEDEEILIRKYFNVGIAVETELGLVVPVVKIAEKKNVKEIAKEISDLARKARERKIDVMDLKGGTFTITNYGSVGGTYGTPLLNPGQSSILGLGRYVERAYVDSKGKLKTKTIMPISITFDHRIADGGQAARFAEKLKQFIEDPTHLLIELT